MWLLSTARAELKFFASPDAVPGGYAILSHVWDKTEDTFRDVRALRTKSVREGGANPRDLVSEKIRRSCILAETHGFKWIWIDTCCIDKSSSAELSEAINSMFRYYSQTAICYAFLRDVSSHHDPEVQALFFRKSVWHERGWTLQELVAPKVLFFVSSSWTIIGTKAEFAPVIEEITDIPVGVLRFQQDLSEISVGMRLSWASLRKTARPEDEAYCLMGIFGIHMPTLYGEGRKAFYRLQEEIMKSSVDTTLFIWSYSISPHVSYCFQPSDIESAFNRSTENEIWPTSTESCRKFHFDYTSCLLAPSPGPFHPEFSHSSLCGAVDTQEPLASLLEDDIPSFSITPHGILAHIPVVEHPTIKNTVLAILASSKIRNVNIGLLLYQCVDQTYPPSRRPFHCVSSFWNSRVIRFQKLSDEFQPKWRDIYISHTPSLHTTIDPKMPPAITSTRAELAPPFRLREQLLKHLPEYLNLDATTSIPPGWDGVPPLALRFRASLPRRAVQIILTLGRCTHTTSTDASTIERHIHWARIDIEPTSKSTMPEPMREPVADNHRCAVDHIGDGRWTVRSAPFSLHGKQACFGASFATCPLNARGDTLVLDVAIVPGAGDAEMSDLANAVL